MKPTSLLPSPTTKHAIKSCLLAVMFCPLIATAVRGEDSKWVTAGTPQGTVSDLSLASFLSEGWDRPWSKFQRGEGTPDMSLLRVQTNFLVQLFRLDTTLETGRTSPAFSGGESVMSTVEYALDRRFMPGVFVNHQWLTGRHGPDDDGSAGGLFGRFQLIETQQSSLAFTLKMVLPDHDLGEHLTTWSHALAGWQDLSPLGLGRTGLYYHVQHEMPGGPAPAGATRNDATYDLSLATTWSSPHATLENFTTFVEAYGKTLLDGEHAERTNLWLTPGFRFTLSSRHILMFGVDIPVDGPRPNDQLFRFTWIANF